MNDRCLLFAVGFTNGRDLLSLTECKQVCASIVRDNAADTSAELDVYLPTEDDPPEHREAFCKAFADEVKDQLRVSLLHVQFGWNLQRHSTYFHDHLKLSDAASLQK